MGQRISKPVTSALKLKWAKMNTKLDAGRAGGEGQRWKGDVHFCSLLRASEMGDRETATLKNICEKKEQIWCFISIYILTSTRFLFQGSLTSAGKSHQWPKPNFHSACFCLCGDYHLKTTNLTKEFHLINTLLKPQQMINLLWGKMHSHFLIKLGPQNVPN